MYKTILEHTSLKGDWRFSRMLPHLPVPGTDALAFLTKELVPFGLTARSVTIESPTNNLGDIAVVFDLANPRIRLRINYEHIEITSDKIQEEDVFNILKVMDIAFNSLDKVEQEIKNGIGEASINFHLDFVEAKVEEYLLEKLSGKFTQVQAIPEAIVFELKLGEDRESEKSITTRVTLAKSKAFDNGLFIEINYLSKADSFETPLSFFQELNSRYESVFSALEIEVIEDDEEE